MSPSFSPSLSKRPSRCKSVQIAAPTVGPRAVLACRLDRNADLLLALNCHIAAELLSLRAQALREAGASA
jgi:hypothetical protein